MKIRKKYTIHSLILIWTLFVVISLSVSGYAQVHPPTPSLVNVPDNSWVLVDQGGVTAPRNIMSYSGGWYDAQYHQLCVFGGGHWDYWGNEVWSFDIATLTWTELYPPDPQSAYYNYNSNYPGALFYPAGEPIQDARPFSKHTYDLMEYVDGAGPIVWGGYSWGDSGTPWCQHCKDTWAFNFSDATWQYLYDGSNPSPNFDAGSGASAFSSQDGLLYVASWGETWVYNHVQNSWTQINSSAPWHISSTMEYDSKRHVIYFFGGEYPTNTTLYRYSISSNTWSQLNPTGTAPGSGAADGPGLAYDSQNDVLLVYHSGTIWVYDPNTNNWERRIFNPRPSDGDYVFGRFRYDPVNNGAWFHGWEGGQSATWFYRYKSGVYNPPPSIPQNLMVTP
jgi:hypothetical protein